MVLTIFNVSECQIPPMGGWFAASCLFLVTILFLCDSSIFFETSSDLSPLQLFILLLHRWPISKDRRKGELEWQWHSHLRWKNIILAPLVGRRTRKTLIAVHVVGELMFIFIFNNCWIHQESRRSVNRIPFQPHGATVNKACWKVEFILEVTIQLVGSCTLEKRNWPEGSEVRKHSSLRSSGK